MHSLVQLKRRVSPGRASPQPTAAASSIIQTDHQPYNPYLAARREWDERYGDLVARNKRLERIHFACLAIALLTTILAAALAFRRERVIPIPVDPSSGRYVGGALSTQPLALTETIKRSTLSDWVIYLRMVTPDELAQRSAVERVYAMISSGSSAQTVVTDFYRNDPPPVRARRETVHIEVNSILPTSDKTYEVDWIETTRDLGGRVMSQQHWKGLFTFVVSGSSPSDERLARLNPMGLYMTNASWSKVL